MPSAVVATPNNIPYASEASRIAMKTALQQSARGLSSMRIVHGNLERMSPRLLNFLHESAILCQPDGVHICDGSETENSQLLVLLQQQGTIVPLPKYNNCWLARTNPADTARVESKTFICTERREDAIPTPISGVQGALGNWMSPSDMDRAVRDRMTNCMRGRTMYVIPYSMGPIGSPLAKVGVELTDSPYVVCSMRLMTRVGSAVLRELENNNEFVRCLHSVGQPKNGVVEMPSWPCDPERTIILHRPQSNEIVSYGSGYGGNSLLGKKCFALRIGSTIARNEGWLAEHMLILGITNPKGVKKYIVAAFPSACGKTNLAMMNPTLPGYKIECVGDDIAWMRFDNNGILRAINPENGFFGVAPGTSMESNPNAMRTIFKDTMFTNVAMTSDGGVFWEGMENEVDCDKIAITDWLGNPWKMGENKTPAAHPNSRFCSPASQCPIIDPAWEDPAGVPISAILFGGRRPKGVPLIYEAKNWQHGVFIGAAMRSESTAAAEYKGKMIMHDPFAMRPFFGYNFGNYLSHWLSMDKEATQSVPKRQLPKIFHVNWFRKSANGKFLWPGFGENSRVLDWVLKRIEGENCAQETPIGHVPTASSINLKGLRESVDFEELFRLDKQFWVEETQAIDKYFKEQLGKDLPAEIEIELRNLENRVNSM